MPITVIDPSAVGFTTASAQAINARAPNSEGTSPSLPRADHNHEVALVVTPASSSPHVLAATTGVLLVDTTADMDVQLPAPGTVSGLLPVLIVDATNNAAGKPIDLVRFGAEKIDGIAATKTLAVNGGRWWLWTDGTDWYTAEAPPLTSSNLKLAGALLKDGTVAMTGDLDLGGHALTNAAGVVLASRTIATTAPLTGGGDLSADRTIAMPAATASSDGYMPWTDKAKLDGIEGGADVTDAANVAAAGAVMDSDFAGTATGTLTRTGVATYAVRKDNLAAGAAPTVTDDSSLGYSVGSRWIVPGFGELVCLDASVGAAKWRGVATDIETVTTRSVSANTTLDFGDKVVFVDTSAGAVTLTAPDPTQNYVPILIKKTSTDANAINIATPTGTIDGAASPQALPDSTSTTRPSWTLCSDGANTWSA